MSIITRICLLLLPVAMLMAEGGGGEPTPAPSNGPGQNPGPGSAGGFESLLPMLIVIGVLVLFMWSGVRKQKREQAQHQEMVNDLKTGQAVITAGGVHGTVVRKGEDTVDIKTGGEDASVITFGLNAINKVVVDGDTADAKS